MTDSVRKEIAAKESSLARRVARKLSKSDGNLVMKIPWSKSASTFTQQQREKHRKERARLKVGDRVAIVGRRHLHCLILATVKKVMPERVAVALTEDWTTDYRIKDGIQLSECPVTRLRGLATQRELEALAAERSRKTRWTLERLIREQLRGFLAIWPDVVRANRRHPKDEPGIHLDEGNFANQLRYHDPKGVLRGRLLLFHEAKHGDKQVDNWDCHGGQYGQPGHVLIETDPKRHRRGIGTALLEEAFIRRNWPIDFDKQGYTLVGVSFIRKFRKSEAWFNHEASRQKGKALQEGCEHSRCSTSLRISDRERWGQGARPHS